MLSVAVAQSSCNDNVISYVLPVLWYDVMFALNNKQYIGLYTTESDRFSFV